MLTGPRLFSATELVHKIIIAYLILIPINYYLLSLCGVWSGVVWYRTMTFCDL